MDEQKTAPFICETLPYFDGNCCIYCHEGTKKSFTFSYKNTLIKICCRFYGKFIDANVGEVQIVDGPEIDVLIPISPA